ncbi:MAG: hypothetical protein IPL83_08070 [Bdellovibrionales bacterium]|nr:hypothetical protein [Bdellovibrionales bacterium]
MKCIRGINFLTRGKDELLYAKIPKQYIATEDVPALKSKAAGIFDTWSWEKQNPEKVPHPIFENRYKRTTGSYQPGGADQYLIQKDLFKEVN